MSYPIDDCVDGVSPEAMDSLRLPAAFDEAAHVTALDIDAFLTQDERSVATLDAKVAAHREVTLSHLLTFHGSQTFDPNRFRWPSFLYIPKGANSRDYWIGASAPDNHRYGLEWTSPATATANRASRQDGTLFSFSQLLNEKAGSAQSSESGVGGLLQTAHVIGCHRLTTARELHRYAEHISGVLSATGSRLRRGQSTSASSGMAADSWRL